MNNTVSTVKLGKCDALSSALEIKDEGAEVMTRTASMGRTTVLWPRECCELMVDGLSLH